MQRKIIRKGGNSKERLSKLADILKQLEDSKFYGDVVVKYEDGRVVLITKTEKIKP
jgi:hypothetical protein